AIFGGVRHSGDPPADFEPPRSAVDPNPGRTRRHFDIGYRDDATETCGLKPGSGCDVSLDQLHQLIGWVAELAEASKVDEPLALAVSAPVGLTIQADPITTEDLVHTSDEDPVAAGNVVKKEIGVRAGGGRL